LKISELFEAFEEDIWQFFHNTMAPHILKYQVGGVNDDDGEVDTKEQMNKILLDAISGEEKKTVYIYMIFLCFSYLLIIDTLFCPIGV
jgi:hypothetical protein